MHCIIGFTVWQIISKLLWLLKKKKEKKKILVLWCIRNLPLVIWWVGRHRGPAGYAVLGCKCRSVPLWLGSPPVRKQQEDKQSVVVQGKRTNALTHNLAALLPPNSQASVHACVPTFICFSCFPFLVPEWPRDSKWLQSRQIFSNNIVPVPGCLQRTQGMKL